MTTVKDITVWLDTLAPQSRKESWDNVGLLCGREAKPVQTVLVALDPFEDVIAEAVELGADLILTHHPLIFHPLYTLTEDTAVSRNVRTLVLHDIAALCAHTNLDIAPEGVGHQLAKALGLTDIGILDPIQTDAQGRQWGLLRAGTVEAQPLEAFLSKVKAALGAPMLRCADGGKPVHRVAVGGGACAEEWPAALRAGCDTFVTSDAKYNDFWDARDAGLTLIDAGHFYTENPVCAFLGDSLQAAFPHLRVIQSRVHRDCVKFY